MPVIVGSNRDENKLFLMFADSSVTRLFGLPLWLNDERRYELLSGYQSRMWKATGVDQPAAAMSRWQSGSVFAYRFDWDEQPKLLFSDFGKMLGAAHAMEIPFVLGHLSVGPANRFVFDEERRPAASALSDAMMSYWGQFAHGARPGQGRDGELPLWQPGDGRRADGAKFLVLDTDAGGGIRMSSDALSEESLIAAVARDDRVASQRERCEVYANFVLWSGTLSEADYEDIDDGACREHPIASFAPAG